MCNVRNSKTVQTIFHSVMKILFCDEIVISRLADLFFLYGILIIYTSIEIPEPSVTFYGIVLSTKVLTFHPNIISFYVNLSEYSLFGMISQVVTFYIL